MSELISQPINTLVRGDSILVKYSDDVYLGTVSQPIYENSSVVLVTVNNLTNDDGKKLPELIVPIKEGSLYKSGRIDEGIRMMDGTEPIVNGIYIADLDLNALQKRNKLVDENTEKQLSKAENLLNDPILIKSEDAEKIEEDAEELEEEPKEENQEKATKVSLLKKPIQIT